MQSVKKTSKAEVDQTFVSLSKAGPSKQPDPTTTLTSDLTTRASDHSDAQPMDTDVYGPPLPPKFTQNVQSEMCALLWKIMTWCHRYQITPKSQTHSRVSECDGRPTVQVEPSSVNRMVTASAGVQTDLS